MPTDSETNLFVFVLITFIVFSATLASIYSGSPYLFTVNPNYPESGYPSVYDPAALGTSQAFSEDNNSDVTPSISVPTQFFYLDTEGDTSRNNTIIGLIWYPSLQDNLYFVHWHTDFWIWGHWEHMNPYPVTQDYAVSRLSNNVSSLFVACVQGDIPSVFAQITFDNSTYDDLADAWDNGHLAVSVSFLTNATFSAMQYDIWGFFTAIYSFKAYDFFPSPLDTIFSSIFWVFTLVMVLYVVKGVL